jgi:trimethylamine:corrinoid methyltransferase-like protein
VGWNPNLFDRTYCDHTGTAAAGDESILERAERTWRQLAASQEPIELPPDFARELDRIVDAAKKELLV